MRKVLIALILSVMVQDDGPSLIVRNGLVVTHDGSRAADVRIRGGVIAEIGQNIAAVAGGREIDARGLLVLPGGVDPHVHLGGSGDDYTTGSAAALAGGVTTISNFVSPQPNEDAAASFERAAALVRAQAVADILLHWRVNDAQAVTASDLAAFVERGQPSLKVFMVRPSFDQHAVGFLTLLASAGRAGVLTMMHCEDAAMLTMITERMIAENRGSLAHYPESRPVVIEAAATERAVAMSEATGAPVYIVHLSSERALRVAEAAQHRGLPVYVETRPIYLHLTRERYSGPDRGLYIGQPPLREKRDQDALWAAISRGTIHVLGTDHLAYTRAQKLDPAQTVASHRAGMSNLQEARPMLYSEGVRSGRITREQFVAVTATNPARLFGLYPRKGTIAVGSDADIVIWDPNETRTIDDRDMLSRSGFSVYNGWKVTGWPRTTLRRGEIVYDRGRVVGRAGSGQLVHRAPGQPGSSALPRR
jgi:dihydropyrimidinase